VGERVLLVEDDSRLADMVSEYLGKAGFHVIHAESGTRGLALREPVDAIILDLMLPDGDGLDICRQIRARSESPIGADRPGRSHGPRRGARNGLIVVEREYIYRQLREGKITDEARRRIERELDLEDASIAYKKEGGVEPPL